MNRVKNLAMQNGINIYNTDKRKLSRNEFENCIFSCEKPDFILSCCYDRIFSKSILEFPKIAALNVHPSLLPSYRGIKPLENAIINGDKTIGVTLHKLTTELDAGEIILQQGGINITDTNTYDELYNQQGILISKIFDRFFKNPYYYLQNGKKQDEKKISFAPRTQFEINITDTVKEIRLKAQKNVE